jgi:hypothetical protein
MTGCYVKTYAVDTNTSRTPEEGAYSPSWPNRLVIIICIVIYILSLITHMSVIKQYATEQLWVFKIIWWRHRTRYYSATVF